MMKSPRKRRGARAAAHSPTPRRRAGWVTASRFDTEPAILRSLERARFTSGAWEGCGISGVQSEGLSCPEGSQQGLRYSWDNLGRGPTEEEENGGSKTSLPSKGRYWH
ncbi:uncharacterized protein LOC132679352 [Panthera onca]